ncbi:poly(U)-specific endoribonuclease-like, partial [Anarrhichthys ocellatus]|uniref:poly(U)-specific endoribonuclease-like n=1 Tax=Anarrhichthys ocellatus TaxID=433405 RepID=UPI0012EDB2BB
FCPTSTQRPPVTARPSCYSNCGGHMGSCSCSSSCQYYGTCCYDYHSTCQPTTRPVRPTTDVSRYSCRNKCGSFLGSCSCTSSCRYQGNCCSDYNSYCQTTSPPTT